ncbi:regulator of G-protein signaling loco [Aplysia californica]|uniref:Regulator of G-protein signaling loco n=1 Tax=Aplysia californica TaxID=6500 RepID=A0ABM1W3S3_APLCA|nr:regulator of G-protein signaling loco [Aplysia californica]
MDGLNNVMNGLELIDNLNVSAVDTRMKNWPSDQYCRVPERRRFQRLEKLNVTLNTGLSPVIEEAPCLNTQSKLLNVSVDIITGQTGDHKQAKLLNVSVDNITGQTGDQGDGLKEQVGRVASWAVHVDKLLQDPVGVEVFSEFLRKEFSEENILFWKACEQYRQLTDDSERNTQACVIYGRFLSPTADDPVNVDDVARSHTRMFLDNPTLDMFVVAQKQIHQLMRRDSYVRFVKSDLYKNKLMEEMEDKPGQTGDQGDGLKEPVGRVASWAVHVDKLLQDPVGVEVFSEFLKKEFSEENILFWKACEQYRQLTSDSERNAQAGVIYGRFLSPTADDPVNVDGAARSHTRTFLDNPTVVMFDVAQKQVYQLMRRDSYVRFVKSDLYKNKLMEEMEGKPLQGQMQDKLPEEKREENRGRKYRASSGILTLLKRFGLKDARKRSKRKGGVQP